MNGEHGPTPIQIILAFESGTPHWIPLIKIQTAQYKLPKSMRGILKFYLRWIWSNVGLTIWRKQGDNEYAQDSDNHFFLECFHWEQVHPTLGSPLIEVKFNDTLDT